MKKLAAFLCVGSWAFFLSPLTVFLSVVPKPGYVVIKTSPPDSEVNLPAHLGGRAHQGKNLLGNGFEPIPLSRLPLDSLNRSLTFIVSHPGFKERELKISGADQLRRIQEMGVVPLDGSVLELEEDTQSYLGLKLEKRWPALLMGLLSGAALIWLTHRQHTVMKRLAELQGAQAGHVTHPFLGIDVGEYRVTEYIGQGGMADVYKAVPSHLLGSPH